MLKFKPQWLRALISLCLVLWLAGCQSIGPQEVNLDRARYNNVVAETDQAEMLNNIVHLRYSEPTSYLKITNVTASYTLNSTLAGGGPTASYTSTRGSPLSSTWTGGLTPTYSYTDSPTLSYIPIDDTTFVTALQTPISFKDVILLYHGGVSTLGLFARLTVLRAGTLDNASFASGIGQEAANDNYQNYLLLVHTIDDARRKREAIYVPIMLGSDFAIMIHFYGNSSSPRVATIKKLLHMPADTNDIVFVDQGLALPTINHDGVISLDTSNMAKNMIFAQFRSVLGIMIFLSHAVEVPQADLNAHRALTVVDAQGKPFDWAPLMHGLMAIHSSASEPEDVFVKTQFRNHWFYISDNDLQSKTTFTMLMSLMTLKTGESDTSSNTGPVLTIPASR